MAKFGFIKQAGLSWEVTVDGVATGVVISAPNAAAVDSVLVPMGRFIKQGEGAELYIDHFRVLSEATGARREVPKTELPLATQAGLDEAATLVRELKAAAAAPVVKP